MTAAHFFARTVDGDRVELEGEEARHASRVLRIRAGEVITVSDGAGTVVRAEVVDAGVPLSARVLDRWADPAPVPQLQVFQAIPKGRKLDEVVQKLTELGVDTVQPFPAARSVAAWDEAKSAAQTARLRSIALGASKQSRRSRLPVIEAPTPLEQLKLPDCTVVLDEEATLRLRNVLPPEPPAVIGVVVGPEGGLDRAEVDTLAAAHAVAVSLGSVVLRTDTAGLAAVAAIAFHYGRLG